MTNRRSRSLALGVALAATGVVTLAACGSDGSSATGTTTAHPSATADHGATSTVSPSISEAAGSGTGLTPGVVAADDPSRCHTDELKVTMGRAQGAAGSTEFPLVFTNTGSRSCRIGGFPGVSYMTAQDGTQVGSAAQQTGPAPDTSELAPGTQASAMVRAVEVGNYPASDCSPKPVAGLRVYPPNDTGSLFVPYATTGCEKPVGQLWIKAVAQGVPGS